MKINDKAIFHRVNSFYDNTKCTIISVDSGRFVDYLVAFDNFPNCNHRDYHNRFGVNENELEQLKDCEVQNEK